MRQGNLDALSLAGAMRKFEADRGYGGFYRDKVISIPHGIIQTVSVALGVFISCFDASVQTVRNGVRDRRNRDVKLTDLRIAQPFRTPGKQLLQLISFKIEMIQIVLWFGMPVQRIVKQSSPKGSVSDLLVEGTSGFVHSLKPQEVNLP